MTDIHAHLTAAAALVDAALPRLDHSSEVCACCGVTKYRNFQQALAHRELKALAAKLRRFAESDALRGISDGPAIR